MKARSIGLLAATILVLTGLDVPVASAQFGALKDAAKRMAEEKRKADETRRQAEEAKAREAEARRERATPAPADPAVAATPAPPASAATAAAAPAAPAAAPTFQAYSKFDFVPGEKVVAIDDFTQDAVGDFPARWNTNASGEIVTIGGQPGRWLKLAKPGFFTPEFITELPDNVTLEFDLAVPP